MRAHNLLMALLVLLTTLAYTNVANADSRYAKINGRLVLILEPEERPKWIKVNTGCKQKIPPCYYAYRGTFKVPKNHPNVAARDEVYKFSFWVGLDNNGEIKINFSTALPGATISDANIEQIKPSAGKHGLSLRTDHFLFNTISSSARCTPFTNDASWVHGGIQCNFGDKGLAAYSVLGDPRIRRAMHTKSGSFGGVLLEITDYTDVEGRTTDLIFSIPVSDKRFLESDWDFTARAWDRLNGNRKYFSNISRFGGLFEIKSVETGRCLTLEDRTLGGVLGSPEITPATPLNSRGETVVQEACGNGDPDVARYANKWYYIDCTNTGCKGGRVVNAFTGQCLSYTDGALSSGLRLKLVPCKLMGTTKRMEFSPLAITEGDYTAGFLASQVNYERGCLSFIGEGLTVQLTQCNSSTLSDMRLDQVITFDQKFGM